MPTNVHLTGLAKDLEARAETGKPIRIGLVGCGEMGTDVVTRTAHMKGIEVAAIADPNPANPKKALEIAFGSKDHGLEMATDGQITSAIEQGKIALSQDSMLVAENPLIDVVIDATGVPAVGAEIGIHAMEHGKHLTMMNVEADVCIGPYLKSEAERLGVVYSLGAGDEPSSCMELIEFVSAMGHEIVCAGKGKNNPLNFDAVPDDYAQEAAARNMWFLTRPVCMDHRQRLISFLQRLFRRLMAAYFQKGVVWISPSAKGLRRGYSLSPICLTRGSPSVWKI